MYRSMAEQDIREDQMTVTNTVDYLRGLKGKDSVLIAPDKLPHPNTGGGYTKANLSNGKWYRIARGVSGEQPSSGIFNIANSFAYEKSRAILFYAFTDAYSDGSFITKIAASSVVPISKARVLSIKSNSGDSYLDVFVRLNEMNVVHIAASSMIGFTLQAPEEVSGDIPEGYSVKEVSF